MMAKSFAAISTVAIVVASPAWAKSDRTTCPISALSIHIGVRRAPMRVEADMGLKELRKAAAGRYPAPIVGAYIGTLTYAAEIDDTTAEVSPGRFCTMPRYIILRLQLDRVIYIPREFVGDECLSSLAHEHEAKHAGAEDAALEQFRPALLPALRAAMRNRPSDPKGSRAEALADLTNVLSAAVEHVLDQVDTTRRQLDAAVNSSVELERLQRACEGRALQEQGEYHSVFPLYRHFASEQTIKPKGCPPPPSSSPPNLGDASTAASISYSPKAEITRSRHICRCSRNAIIDTGPRSRL
jgi:hypothetical protein